MVSFTASVELVNIADEVEAESAEADEVKAQRLEKLAAFQLQMILHAFKCKYDLPISEGD